MPTFERERIDCPRARVSATDSEIIDPQFRLPAHRIAEAEAALVAAFPPPPPSPPRRARKGAAPPKRVRERRRPAMPDSEPWGDIVVEYSDDEDIIWVLPWGAGTDPRVGPEVIAPFVDAGSFVCYTEWETVDDIPAGETRGPRMLMEHHADFDGTGVRFEVIPAPPAADLTAEHLRSIRSVLDLGTAGASRHEPRLTT